MALYCYLKAQPKLRPVRSYNYLLSFGSLLAGTFLIVSVIFPIVSYQIKSGVFRRRIISPVASSDNLRGKPVQGVVLGRNDPTDYTKASNWYPSLPDLPPQPSKITAYTISIPKLGIHDGLVQIGGEDLMKSLVQYPGTALPGQYGNVVIFGHSVLPQFFNPKNYKTIFSTLPKIKRGDEILVSFDGVQYRYIVVGLFEAEPDDVTVLQQYYDSEYLSLITCVPPGTYLRRLIVKAKLVHS